MGVLKTSLRPPSQGDLLRLLGGSRNKGEPPKEYPTRFLNHAEEPFKGLELLFGSSQGSRSKHAVMCSAQAGAASLRDLGTWEPSRKDPGPVLAGKP